MENSFRPHHKFKCHVIFRPKMSRGDTQPLQQCLKNVTGHVRQSSLEQLMLKTNLETIYILEHKINQAI